MADMKPLVLDVDGTYLRTDLLFEAFWAGLSKAPLNTLKQVFRHFRDPARLKAELTGQVALRTDLMPRVSEVARMAEAAQQEGCEIVLASASDQRVVAQLAEEAGFSDRAVGSDGVTNRKGTAKAAVLVELFGERGFHYAGNERVDRAVWDKADGAIVVGQLAETRAALEQAGHPVTHVPERWRWRDAQRALRPHQWVKNVLLFLPMIAAHAFEVETFILALLGIVAFSAAASSIYIINDLLDLEADRLHETKCNRPFASGAVPIRIGMMLCAGLLVVALGVSALLGTAFSGVIVFYLLFNLAYSLGLKRMRWVDVFSLATMYTLRVVAGAMATGVEASSAMLIFVFPVFLTLGCVKRMTELAKAKDDARLPGRGYGRADRGDLLNMAGLGTVGALVVFALYTVSAQAMELYETRWILWLGLIPIAAWLIRMVALGYHGRMDYDPIVFALRDRRGIGLMLLTLSLMFWSAGLWVEWFG